jgi:phosphoserine phosphatase
VSVESILTRCFFKLSCLFSDRGGAEVSSRQGVFVRLWRGGMPADVLLSKTSPCYSWSQFQLLAMDMDSTLINIECIDEIGDVVGKKAEIAQITEATMRGEITDFQESLRLRVALLEGVPEAALLEVYEQRSQLNPGVEVLLEKVRAEGLKTLLVSGGFTFFTDRLRARLGLDFAYGNELELVDGRLTGRVLGRIVDGAEKRRLVEQTCAEIGCTASAAIVVGDGANDIPMMQVGGLSVAFHAKPMVQAAAMVQINAGGLDALLECFCD